ncbi:hypothetical protein PIROE2DRAFT_5156 [Piromyces sp. E2]|nr:hypothetical protein PIROE2DRAFT_5156 [Piromyces sp. E2]|eukprot:OUM67407.1 hypothetical protein PIROE2DRAFT_5156 [Piromyces sp. E2]
MYERLNIIDLNLDFITSPAYPFLRSSGDVAIAKIIAYSKKNIGTLKISFITSSVSPEIS